MKVLMVASENDAIPNGKIGGIGDVIRDVPTALSELSHEVDIVLPSYGRFHTLDNAQFITRIQLTFFGQRQFVDVYQLSIFDEKNNRLKQWVLDHPLFSVGQLGTIYCDDPDDRPFATDATKFAMFSAAVATATVEGIFGNIDVIHLHDWHAAVLAVLREFSPEYQQLKSIRLVYTVHNLALQGIRPIEGDVSSLNSWFPTLSVNYDQVGDLRYAGCFNPMRAGITLADKVHLVSPTYATEVLKPSDPDNGFIGGEGLENDLHLASTQGRLCGILNGCDYENPPFYEVSVEQLLAQCEQTIMGWMNRQSLNENAHLVALARIKQIQSNKTELPRRIYTSIGRLTAQKVSLFLHSFDGKRTLEHLLASMSENSVFIMLGSGDKRIEQKLANLAAQHDNFLFLNGYQQALSEILYVTGDLFLMPSSFEPCGISQMLALRAGQPCIVHGVGGLNDTITDNYNGFVFKGQTIDEQARAFVDCFGEVNALMLKKRKWQTIQKQALDSRFYWKDAVLEYERLMYSG